MKKMLASLFLVGLLLSAAEMPANAAVYVTINGTAGNDIITVGRFCGWGADAPCQYAACVNGAWTYNDWWATGSGDVIYVYGLDGHDHLYVRNDSEYQYFNCGGQAALFWGLDHNYACPQVYLVGGDDGDVIVGGSCAEHIGGNDGNDVLIGGGGNDWLWGGYGSDCLSDDDVADYDCGEDPGGTDIDYEDCPGTRISCERTCTVCYFSP